MKKNIMKSLALVATLAISMGALAGCGSNTGDEKATTTAPAGNAAETTAKAEAELSGTITMAGSTSMEKLANAAAEVFMSKYDNVIVTAEFTGSGAGVEAVIAKAVDIGNSSRSLKDNEKANGVVENIVAIDGIAVILDTANTATNLTKDQLISIYKGEIKNWSEVGGANEPIVVVGREAGSGTRGAFEEILDIADQAAYSNELDNTGAVLAKVASTKGAIGYVSLDVVNNSVMAAQLEGVEPTAENIASGNYFLSRPFVMATNGEITAQSELVQAFFEFLQSDEGVELVKAVGLIPVN